MSKLQEHLIELSKRVDNYRKITVNSNISPIIELSDDLPMPYPIKVEALHPGEYKGFIMEEREISMAKNTIFNSDGNFHNYDINKDHKSSRKMDSSVDDAIGRVTTADYDYSKQAYILEGEIYDKSIALKIANKILKYVSLRINPGRVDNINGRRYARDLNFEELSLVRAPGDPKAKIVL